MLEIIEIKIVPLANVRFGEEDLHQLKGIKSFPSGIEEAIAKKWINKLKSSLEQEVSRTDLLELQSIVNYFPPLTKLGIFDLDGSLK